MKVLIACEESQRVCIAFRDRGHEAYSCDLVKCSGGHPEWHIKGDCLGILRGGGFRTMDGKIHVVNKWDLIIAHPPCTYLSRAGACRLYPSKGQVDNERFVNGLIAKAFFMAFWWYGYFGCGKMVIENPTPLSVFNLPKPTQVIQAYEYGDPYTKRTCLWEFGVPPLKPTNIVKPKGPYICGSADAWRKQSAEGEVLGREKSSKYRSKTFPGIAKAMAEQWG